MKKVLIEAYKAGLKKGMKLVKESKGIPPAYLKALGQIFEELTGIEKNLFSVANDWKEMKWPDSVELEAFLTLRDKILPDVYEIYGEKVQHSKKADIQELKAFVNLVNSFLSLLRENGLLDAFSNIESTYDEDTREMAKRGYSLDFAIWQLENALSESDAHPVFGGARAFVDPKTGEISKEQGDPDEWYPDEEDDYGYDYDDDSNFPL